MYTNKRKLERAVKYCTNCENYCPKDKTCRCWVFQTPKPVMEARDILDEPHIREWRGIPREITHRCEGRNSFDPMSREYERQLAYRGKPYDEKRAAF